MTEEVKAEVQAILESQYGQRDTDDEDSGDEKLGKNTSEGAYQLHGVE